jgi:hypothetical protein
MSGVRGRKAGTVSTPPEPPAWPLLIHHSVRLSRGNRCAGRVSLSPHHARKRSLALHYEFLGAGSNDLTYGQEKTPLSLGV